MKVAVSEKFGEPIAYLSLTQKIIYPLDLYIHQNKLISSIKQSGVEQEFQVTQGESVSMVCLRLEQVGLIDDPELLRTYLVYSGLDRRLQSGTFILSPVMSPVEIAEQLMDASSRESTVTVLPGWRIEEVALNVAGSGLGVTAENFLNAAYFPALSYLELLPFSDVSTLEGYLFPGSYVFTRDAVLDEVISTLLTEFTANVDQLVLDGIAQEGLSMQQAVTLASIVEREAVLSDEKPIIASVFFNRLAQGMRLETDPTVQYALGYQETTQTWWKSRLTEADLMIDSPYNTYLVNGLPPTPICNPDLDSLLAVAFPAETPYFYFRSACDGSGRHNFAITYEEHLNNQCE